MNYPYCLPIIKASKKEVLGTIDQHKQDYSYFEIYLDYIEDLDTTFVEKLADDNRGLLVLVFRRLKLEAVQMSFEQRKKALTILKDKNVMIDLDIETQAKEIDMLGSEHKCQLIISYHNYRATPENGELHDISQQIRKKNPDILKIATNCQNEYDALRLLAMLLHFKETDQKAIVLGMGEHGAVTRIFGTLWGNELAFAPAEIGQQSAPGQLTRQALDNILKNIGE